MITQPDINIKNFKPHPIFKSGTLQTIASQYWFQLPDNQVGQQHNIPLEDGDHLACFEYKPTGWKETDRTVFLVHGLTGCYQSNYIIRLSKKINKLGHNVVRVNLRGCGPGFGLAKGIYHSGRSEDTRQVLKYFAQKYPNSPMTQVGCSLGANITLKMAGESTDNANLDSLIAVSPPAELEKTAHRILKMGKVFDQFFVNKLRKDVKKRFQQFPDLTPVEIPKFINIIEFDDLYTGPQAGFKSGLDYYQQSSSAPLLENIKLPSLILHSMDDPIVDGSFLDKHKEKKNFDLAITQQGGHVAFLDSTSLLSNFRWMDEVIIAWLKQKL